MWRAGWVAGFVCAVVAGVGMAEPATRPATQVVDVGSAGAREQSALDFARRWTEEFRVGRGGEALKASLDVDELLGGILGARYSGLEEAEKVKARNDMRQVMEAVHASPAIRQLMMQVSFEGFSAKMYGPRHYLVSYSAAIPGTQQKIPNCLLLVWHESGWKVADMGTYGSLMGPALREEYEAKAKDMSVTQNTATLVQMMGPTPGPE